MPFTLSRPVLANELIVTTKSAFGWGKCFIYNKWSLLKPGEVVLCRVDVFRVWKSVRSNFFLLSVWPDFHFCRCLDSDTPYSLSVVVQVSVFSPVVISCNRLETVTTYGHFTRRHTTDKAMASMPIFQKMTQSTGPTKLHRKPRSLLSQQMVSVP